MNLENITLNYTTKDILDFLNSNKYKFKQMDKEEINSNEIGEYDESGELVNKYKLLFYKEIYNEYLDESIEIYWISKNNKEIIDYIARILVKNKFGDKHYRDFHNVKRKDIKTTVWEFGGDKFYEE